ncbi:MAG TPA: YbaY family lipoprotein [Candidatus Krumholzibacteria bacterium]|nr:YbaY family lipoprotein [Candidatus Krumholzibacteria bacterium]
MTRSILLLNAMLVSAALVLACNKGPKVSAYVTGTVTYLQQMELPPDAEVHVALEDISRADVPARVIAADTIMAGGQQVPVAFSIGYDPGQIEKENTYSIRAEIRMEGETRFISTQSHPVLTRGAGTSAEIVVMALKTEHPDDSPLVGTYWKLIELRGNPVVPGTRRDPHITFLAENHRVAATGGCNQMTGGYVTSDDALTFTPLASTRMACPDVMEQEAALVTAMAATAHYRIEGPALDLLDASRQPVARLLAAEHEE